MLANLRALLRVVIDIVLLRRGPDSLPASNVLLVAVIGVFVAVNTALATRLARAGDPWIGALVLGIVFVLAWYRILLMLAGKPERFAQTLTAIFAARTVFNPVLMPLTSMLQEQSATPAAVPGPLVILALVLTVWMVTVEVRIVRAAFEWPTMAAVLVVLAHVLTALLLMVMIFAPQPQPS